MSPEPYYCNVCRSKPESYFGRLVFPTELEPGAEPPICPNHKAGMNIPLTKVAKRK